MANSIFKITYNESNLINLVFKLSVNAFFSIVEPYIVLNKTVYMHAMKKKCDFDF